MYIYLVYATHQTLTPLVSSHTCSFKSIGFKGLFGRTFFAHLLELQEHHTWRWTLHQPLKEKFVFSMAYWWFLFCFASTAQVSLSSLSFTCAGTNKFSILRLPACFFADAQPGDPTGNVNLSPFEKWRSAYECMQNVILPLK